MKKRKDGASVHGGGDGVPYHLSTEGDTVHVTVELPGIREELIQLDLDGKVLIISVDGRGPVLRKTIALPCEARIGKKQFRKGVLELLLHRSD